jgi:cytochrome oxidase Cu insertion factor (SCO1/SenC/PrrC family)
MLNQRRTLGIAIIATLLMCVVPALAVYEVGDIVEDFTLNDAYGNPVSLSDFEGLTIVLAFWTPS